MNIYNLAYNSAESQWLMPELIFAETSEAEIITLAGENGEIWPINVFTTNSCSCHWSIKSHFFQQTTASLLIWLIMIRTREP